MTDKHDLRDFTTRLFRKKQTEEPIPAREALGVRPQAPRPDAGTPAPGGTGPKADFLDRFNKDIPVQEFQVVKSVYMPGPERTIKARPTSYGFITDGTEYIPIGIAFWIDRTAMADLLGTNQVVALVLSTATIYANRLLPESTVINKFLVRSRLVESNGKYFRSRHERMNVGGFETVQVDDQRPVIHIAPPAAILTELKKRALLVNSGKRPVTVQFD